MQMISINSGCLFSSVSPSLRVYIYCVAVEDLTIPLSTSSPFNRGFTKPYCLLWWYSVWTIKPHCYRSECIYTCTFNTCQSTFRVTCKCPHIAVVHISIYMTTSTMKTCKTMQYEGFRGNSAIYTGCPLIPITYTLTVLNMYMSFTLKDTILNNISVQYMCVKALMKSHRTV